MTGVRITPRTWQCIVTTAAAPATTHQPARRVPQACQAAASAIELDKAIRFGFQMNVDSSTALPDTARRSAATMPAIGPAIARASHPVTATAITPPRAIQAVTAVGSAPETRAAGARST